MSFVSRFLAPLAVLLLCSALSGSAARADLADDSISFVISRIEGMTLVANDAGRGPSKFGINQQANPDIAVHALSYTQAARIYRERYWKPINADHLPAGLRTVAFDTVLHFGLKRGRQMLAQAHGDAAVLVTLRVRFHEYLLKSAPAIYGSYAAAWRRRDRLVAAVAEGRVIVPPAALVAQTGKPIGP